ncbi:GNAT family N-acetyltransferase [Alteromonas ponticola]|uniref:GNAT family N-acetyltransferase n=1 Tax=Alteromonas ponticola TaxID=2720613 RepID=A0ABX1R2P6_9ALTE|nr:GNAT family N-acetyltransferase [Alteromonas ponticola]NMH60740.1 GNAT family N-acetyltransferase [Alteromonas ponticola]
MVIRQASSADVHAATQLLYQAGEQLLCSIFGNGDKATALDFLMSAWLHEAGQYGCNNHWLACEGNQPVGIITCWHDQLPADFDHQTLVSITEYFGIAESLNVIARSQHIAESLQSPDETQLGIGHVAVDANYRRKGVATAMLTKMEQLATFYGKQTLILDVETHNLSAIQFYQAKGYTKKGVQPPFLHMFKAL